jgi:GT2 family glycosyltransferase
MNKVTAVVLNYNSSEDCKKCVDFLRKQDYDNFDIVVVDNASTDLSEVEELKNICNGDGIRLIVNAENKGFSVGNNVGLREAVANGADWMLVINPDVELRDSHYISYVMEQVPLWQNVAVIGTNVLLPSGEKQNPMREITAAEEIIWPMEMVKQKLGIWNGYKTEDKTGYCEKLSGCCFFISKEFLIKNNYLDESVFMYCEEPILTKSVLKAGYKELYIKEVTANHEHYSHKKEGNSHTKMPLFFKSRIYYIENYSGYSEIQKKLAIISRKLQSKLWER